VALDSLRADPANARLHNERNLDAIGASLQRFGQAEPLVVNSRSGRLVAGHGRLAAMRKLGWTEADIVEVDLAEIDATALGIALNRTAELAAWDDGALAALLQQLGAEDALAGVGFEEVEIQSLLRGLEEQLGAASLDDPGPGEPPESPVSRLGDLWILGDHRLLCGDSTKLEDMARLMAGEKAHLLATDPPYLVDYRGGNHPQSWANRPQTRDKHWDDYVDPSSGLAFFRGFLEAALSHCVEDVAVYQWHAHRRQALVEQAWRAAGLLVHQQVIWTKARPVLTRSWLMWAHEPCFVGWPEGKMPSKARRPPPNATTVWPIDQVDEPKGLHPTTKPRELFERPIGWHTRRGEVCLEPFSGSGTQIVAAERLGRRCFALELSPAFVDVALVRWQQASGKQALLDAHERRTFEELARERGVEPAPASPAACHQTRQGAAR